MAKPISSVATWCIGYCAFSLINAAALSPGEVSKRISSGVLLWMGASVGSGLIGVKCVFCALICAKRDIKNRHRQQPAVGVLVPRLESALHAQSCAAPKRLPCVWVRLQTCSVWRISESQNLKRASKSLILSLELIQRADFAPRAYTA